MVNSNPQAWEVWEEVGISIPNPRSVVRVPRPENITDDEWMALIEALEKADIEREVRKEKITDVHNTLRHANYEQAAKEIGCSVDEYFKNGYFASEIERMFEITDFLMMQIDPNTGTPYAWQQMLARAEETINQLLGVSLSEAFQMLDEGKISGLVLMTRQTMVSKIRSLRGIVKRANELKQKVTK